MENIDKNVFKNLTILCVEDEEWVRESLVDFLNRRFKTVFSAKDGEEGLRLFKENRPDIVMTDIQMPQMNGLEMSKAIKKLEPSTPIAIVSAFNDIDYLTEAIDIGVESYVNKPVDSTKLNHNLYRCAIRAKFKEAQQKLEQSEEVFRAVTENSPSGICIVSDKYLYVNQAMEEITGFDKEELYGKTPFDLMHFKDVQEEQAFAADLEKRRGSEAFIAKFQEIKIITKQKTEKYIDIISNTIKYKNEHVTIANYMDTTERRWFEDELGKKRIELEKLNVRLKTNLKLIEQKNIELKEQLYTDKLTGLPNRLKLIESVKASEDPVVMLLNIDSFKEINDFYGNDVGDLILIELAKIIEHHIKTHKLSFGLYRLQADEYAILSQHEIMHETLSEYIHRLHEAIEKHLFQAKDQQIHLNITAGVARGTPASLLNRADMALKRAKKMRKQHLFYDKSMMVVKEYEQNLKWLKILKGALEEDRIVAFFQPILNNKEHTINKFECLARLVSEEGNIYAPFFFLDISKRSRLYENITRRVLEDAIDKFKDNDLLFSINISIEDIIDEKTIEFITKKFKETDIANRVIFEILESEQIENYESVSDFISKMKSFGCKIAIDDFGSGYSNFAHIINLDIDYIKIDSSIIKNADKDQNSQIISKTIVDFSKRLEIETIAEFVHSKDVFSIVNDFGVNYSQGYFIGEPNREIITNPLN